MIVEEITYLRLLYTAAMSVGSKLNDSSLLAFNLLTGDVDLTIQTNLLSNMKTLFRSILPLTEHSITSLLCAT